MSGSLCSCTAVAAHSCLALYYLGLFYAPIFNFLWFHRKSLTPPWGWVSGSYVAFASCSVQDDEFNFCFSAPSATQFWLCTSSTSHSIRAASMPVAGRGQAGLSLLFQCVCQVRRQECGCRTSGKVWLFSHYHSQTNAEIVLALLLTLAGEI